MTPVVLCYDNTFAAGPVLIETEIPSFCLNQRLYIQANLIKFTAIIFHTCHMHFINYSFQGKNLPYTQNCPQRVITFLRRFLQCVMSLTEPHNLQLLSCRFPLSDDGIICRILPPDISLFLV